MSKYIGTPVVNISADTVDVTGDITTTDTTPEVIIVNNTHEDTDGGREGKVTFKGQQSGGEETTLAQIQASHDGTSDDEKGDLIFKTNDGSDGANPTEAMRITSQQRVGILTNDPSHALDVTQTGATSARVGGTGGSGANDGTIIINSGGTGDAMLRFDYETNTDRARIGTSTSSQELEFYTAGDNERMRIDSDGNVGIGESNPSLGSSANGLHITGASGNDGVLKLDSSDSTHSGKIQFTENGTDQWRIAYDPTNNHLEFTESGVGDRMVIEDGGKIGIGVNDPDAVLDISGGTNKLGILRVVQRVSGAAAYGLDVGLDPTLGDPVFSKIENDVLAESFRIRRTNGALISSGGITLGTSGAAYAAANTIDDYEEGTWTPEVEFSGANTGQTFSTNREIF